MAELNERPYQARHCARPQRRAARYRARTITAPHLVVPVIFDPGNDLPARVWWAVRKGHALLVAFNDPTLAGEQVQRAATALGLSPAQRRLATAVVEGLSLIDAAHAEGVRVSTARTQLQRIFDKVGVRTQPALVRALLSFTGPQ